MNISMYANFSHILETQGADAACAMAARLGCSSVELLEMVGEGRSPVIKDDNDIKALKKSLEREQLSLACYSVAVNLWQKGMSADTVTDMEKELMLHAQRAAALGSPFLHHTLLLGVDKGALPFGEALSLIVPAAVRVARYAHGLGITCIYEGQGMFFNGVEGFGAFYYAVKKECPYVGVCGDIGNMLFVDEEPTEFFRVFASEIKHVHIKDYIRSDAPVSTDGWTQSRGGAWLKDVVIGSGIIDIPTCLYFLKKTGYNGAFALENCHDGDFEYGVKQGIEFLKDLF